MATARIECPTCLRTWPLPVALPARVDHVGVPCCPGVVVPVDRDDDTTA